MQIPSRKRLENHISSTAVIIADSMREILVFARGKFLLLVGMVVLTGCAAAPTPKARLDGPLGAFQPPGRLLPSNDRNWSPDMAVLTYAEFDGTLMTVHDIRHCDYRTAEDYTVRHYDKTFDLNEVQSVDFLVAPFPGYPQLAHTMLSFGFKDGYHLGVSVEIRREKGEKYDPIKASFNQYELMYVVADERDLIPLQANIKFSDLYLYRSIATPEQARALLIDVMQRVNQLAETPEFYNTLTNNCTTNIFDHVNRVFPGRVPYGMEILLPGLSDRLAYDLGLIETHGTFEETRRRARINYQAYAFRDAPDYSQKIRR